MSEYIEPIISGCPVCRAVNFVRIGTPPSIKKHNYLNRCSGKELTGEVNQGGNYKYIFEDSWRGLKTRPNKLCGFPLTTEDGKLIPLLPVRVYIDFTQGGFSVKELKELVMESALASA